MPSAFPMAVSGMLAACAALAASPSFAAPMDMNFYQHIDFKGARLGGRFGLDQCYSVGCIDKAISSLTYNFRDVPSAVDSTLVFFSSNDCSSGIIYVLDANTTTEVRIPRVPDDGVNDRISSFVVISPQGPCRAIRDAETACDNTYAGTYYP